MKLIEKLLPLVVFGPGHACAKKAEKQQVGLPPGPASDVVRLRDRVIEIGNQVLFREEWDSNTVVSPTCIIGALYMLAAATDGEAHEQLAQLLDFSGQKNESKFDSYNILMNYLIDESNAAYKLTIANGLYYDTRFPVRSEYSKVIQELFRASYTDIRQAHFGSDPRGTTKKINEWVSEKTEGKIDKMFEDTIDRNTAAMLLSSLYFKGSWAVPFDVINHGWYCWNGLDGGCDNSIQFMAVDNYFDTYWGEDYTVVDVPLTKKCEDKSDCTKKEGIENVMTFQIWIPNKILDTHEQHTDFQSRMRRDMSTVLDEMRGSRINLVMPKISLGFKKDLKQTFFDLGVTEIFKYGNHFGPIFGDDMNEQISVSEIKHAVKLDIDENGIEGAATTAVGMMFRSMPPDVVADRPFYFSISSNCQLAGKDSFFEDVAVGDEGCIHRRTPIFIGKVVDIQDATSK